MKTATRGSLAEAKRAALPARVESTGYFLFAVVVVGVLAHGLSLRADFYMDDMPWILQKEAVRNGEWYLFPWRWIPYLGFTLTYSLFGASSVAFHVSNLVLHVLTSCLLFTAGRDMLGRLEFLKTDGARRNAAFFGALVFAAHPLCSEAVNYARCTMIEYVTLFSLITAWAAVRFFDAMVRMEGADWGGLGGGARRWGMIMLAGVGLAASSKNPGLFHALANVLIIGLAMGGLRKLGPVMRWSPTGRRWLVAVPLALVVGYLSYQWSAVVREVIVRWGDIHLVHTLTQGRIFWEYCERIFYPHHLASDHYVAWSGGFRDVEGVAKTVGFFLFSLAAFTGLFVKRFRVVALLLCLALAPFQLRFLYPVKELMVEYRAYPAMPWVGLLAGTGLAYLFEWRRVVGVGLTVVVVVACVGRSAIRSTVWSSVERLAENVRVQYPLNGRAITHLQHVAYAKGDYERVIELRNEMVDVTLANERFNVQEQGRRAYEYVRAQQNFCNAEQLAVYALAEWKGDEVALEYADQRLRDLAKKLPQFYLDPKSGGYNPGNTLVKARSFVKNRLRDAKGG